MGAGRSKRPVQYSTCTVGVGIICSFWERMCNRQEKANAARGGGGPGEGGGVQGGRGAVMSEALRGVSIGTNALKAHDLEAAWRKQREHIPVCQLCSFNKVCGTSAQAFLFSQRGGRVMASAFRGSPRAARHETVPARQIHDTARCLAVEAGRQVQRT